MPKRPQPEPDPTDRLISLGEALTEFYNDQMAKAAREGQRLGALDMYAARPAPKGWPGTQWPCNCGKSGAHESTIECLGGVR